MLAAGLLVRLLLAQLLFLDGDEVLHYLLSVQPSVGMAYQASLTTAHPPLLIVLLYYWRSLGHSELFLRLPSVLCGVGFCCVGYLWLVRVVGKKTAAIAFALLLFSPAMIALSVEIRQYALLLFFCASSLYFLERSVAESSPWMMLASLANLYLALLTHYSALLFALTLGFYALVRFYSSGTRGKILLTWLLGQGVAVGIVGFLYTTQVLRLKARGLTEGIANSYVSKSIFHPGQNSAASFIGGSNIRFFHYLYYQQEVGIAALFVFLYGVVLLLRRKTRVLSNGLGWQLALLLTLPFCVNLITALTGIYPYGSTRHNSYLALFAMTGTAIGLNGWERPSRWLSPTVIAALLLACALFPAPTWQYMRPSNQTRNEMTRAIDDLVHSMPANSVILTDQQGGLALSYYLCHAKVAATERSAEFGIESRCSQYRIISINTWIFGAKDFSSQVETARRTYGLAADTPLWFFQAGWSVDNEPALRAELRLLGCQTPRNFGKNILVCPLM